MIILCPGRHAATILDVGQRIERMAGLTHDGHPAQLLQSEGQRWSWGRRISGYEAVRP